MIWLWIILVRSEMDWEFRSISGYGKQRRQQQQQHEENNELLEIYLYITSIYNYMTLHFDTTKNIWLWNIDLHFRSHPGVFGNSPETFETKSPMCQVGADCKGIPEPVLVRLGNGWCYFHGAPWIPSIYSICMHIYQHHGSWVMVRIEIRFFLGSSGSIPYCTSSRKPELSIAFHIILMTWSTKIKNPNSIWK